MLKQQSTAETSVSNSVR